MPKFPFTNYHELNLDWILKKVNALFDASEENARTIRTYETRLSSAEQTATSAATAATSAQQLADAAAANADNALSVAGTADAKADSALTAATNAAGAVSGALTTAQEARQIAGNAQSAAADAGALANDASNAAAAAQQTANSAQVAANTNAGNISTLQSDVTDLNSQLNDMESDLDSIAEKATNLYDSNNVVLGKNWAGGDAANRAYIQIPVTAGKTYTVVIPTNVDIPRIAVVQLNTAPSSLGSFYIDGGNSQVFTAVANCVNIRIQFEGSTTLTESDFLNYAVEVFEGTSEYLSAIDNVARSKLPKNKKYIFIGDSYCVGYNPDGNVTGWGERLKSAMGLTNDNCIIACHGGVGFYHASESKTFATLLDEAGTGIDKTDITGIVVCGGWNDNSESANNVYFNGVLAFATKVSTEYPNATLYVGMIGASNNADVKSRLQSTVLYAYQYGVLRKNYRYLNMVEYALSVSHLASDGIHPNADGQVEITLAIKQALETGSAGLPYRLYNTIKTS